ncbi:MAG: AAA family ATPase [Planctomycetes bacterium]|nr:AAA family ATPase [Planctomycetota bacterium]
MPRPCPGCGTANADTAKFCNECGAKLGAALTPAPLPRGADYVTRRISRSELSRGERRIVTVLFADIKDYTALSERLDPEQVEDLVGGLFREFSDVIAAHGGYVDKFMGDAILALFGAPRSLGDDAERAVNAALEMQRRAKAANAGRDVRLDVRIGLDTGEVVVGNLGQRGEYTAIGDPVNTANRVQGAAEIGAVYIGEATAQQVRARFKLTQLAPVTLKGKTEPVVLWRVEGVLKQTEHYAGAFVGRRRELELLLASFDSSVRERMPRFVLVRADAGMGKSRLFYEFRRRLRALKHAPLRVTAAFAPAGMEPMQGMRQVARALLRLDRAAPAPAAQAAVAAAVGALAAQGVPEAAADHLRYLLGLGAANSGLEAKQRREGASLVLRLLLQRQAESGPMLLAFEDIHWADEDSLSFLRDLARSDLRGPVFVLALGRPEAIELVRDLLADPFENIELRPMEAAEVTALSAAVLAQGVADEPLAQLVAERSGGNPFVAEELLKGLAEAGALTLEHGHYSLAPGRSPSDIPVGVRSILASRIDALGARERAVLTALSVLGREFRRAAADRLCGESAETALGQLVERGMLVDLGDDRGQRRFMFCHALLQEVAYSGLLRRDKVQLHRLAAEFYREQLADGEPDPRRLSRLAWHLASAGDSAGAASAYHQAGHLAARRWMGAFAAEQFQHALTEFDRAPGATIAGLAGAAARLRLVSDLVESLKETGKLAQALEIAKSVAETAADPRDLAPVMERAANAAWRKSEYEQAREFAARGRALFESANDADGAARCRIHEAAALTSLGRVTQARELVDGLNPGADAPWRADWLRAAAVLCLEQGRAGDALAHEQQRAELARRSGQRRTLASALANVAMICSDLGRFDEAGRLFTEALAEYRAIGDLFNVSVVLSNLGNFRRRTGDVTGALAAHEEALRLSAQLGDDYGVLLGELNAATCYLSLGQFTRALRSIEGAQPALRRFKAPQLAPQVLLNRAVAASRTGDFRLARASVDAARALCVEHGNARGLLQCDLQTAEDALRGGEFDRAAQALADLQARARQLGYLRYAASAADKLIEQALARGNAGAAGRALAAARDLGPVSEDDQRVLAVQQALAEWLAGPEQDPQGLDHLLPAACATASDAQLLAAAALCAAHLAATVSSPRLEAALGWADRAIRAMEEGGRADARHALTLAARGRLKRALGRDATADLARARASAQRLEAAWIIQWLDQADSV